MTHRLTAKRPHQHSCATTHPKEPWCFCLDREAMDCTKCRHVAFSKYVDSLSTPQLLERRA